MSKLKTKKGVAKRFKLTKKRKIKFPGCGKSHLLSNKTRKRLRKLRGRRVLAEGKQLKYLKRLLPYG